MKSALSSVIYPVSRGALVLAVLSIACFACSGAVAASADDNAFLNRMGTVSYDPDPGKIESMVPLLKEKKLGLGINVRPKSNMDDIVRIAEIAESAGIPLVVLPDITVGPIIFANSTNWREYTAWVRKVMDFIEEKKLPIKGLVVDMEPSMGSMRKLQSKIEEGKDRFAAIQGFLKKNMEDPLFEEARDGYRDMVDEAHKRGFHVLLTTVPFVLDDLADGDTTLQRALQCPVQGIDWDQIVFQAYSSMYGEITGTSDPEALAGFVYEYAKLAKKHYGDRGALALGLIPDPNWKGLTSPARLEADIRAAMAGGLPLRRLHLYALEGLIQDPNPERWLEWNLSDPKPRKADSTLILLQTLLHTFDKANP